ncbi:MAG TPA: hypothetical protein VGQ21_15400 [Thermoanaerobaculia bacterium]|jgi:hypothetical protein|nr:hypothetical protein [Thermoanaerobaculia bacterium]
MLNLRRTFPLIVMWLCLVAASPLTPNPKHVPAGVIFVKGAEPSSSDTTTPLPENGSVAGGRYRNAYFGLAYPIPQGWTAQPAGPPPSDGGSYVLAQFALSDTKQQRVRAHVLITAQDFFFSARPVANPAEMVTAVRRSIGSDYEIEREPGEVKIAGRTFARFAYKSPLAGLHWLILSTAARCHAVTFTFTATDTAALNDAVRAMNGFALGSDDDPKCVTDYATAENVIARVDPHLGAHRFNTIPVRIIVDREGRVKHIHLLAAFADQSAAIIAALQQWRFKPYLRDSKPTEVETGIVFGVPRSVVRMSGK